ncbi:MAG: site-2 protease family protein [Kiritimatiellae bacterium]|nr:site-2 protease family protein [Kiritimatiellia bacterium]
MEIIVTTLYIAACVLLFALAIVIHEFGHFIVALRLGLRVEAFSIGFGPVLWKKKVGGVEYRLSAIPLGGYVSIPDVDPEGTKALEGEGRGGKEEGKRERIPAWKEILVAVAGPFMNVVLAVGLAILLACVPSAKFGVLLLDVEEVFPDGPGAAAGIQAGDRIVSINGNSVRTKSDMQTEFIIAKGRASKMILLRGGTNVVVSVEPKFEKIGPVLEVPMLYVSLKPSDQLGAAAWMPDRSPLRQLAWDAGSIFRVLKGLVTPREAKATSQALGGPVMIAEGLYRQVRRDPWDGIGFLRFLNVNLAILNLLPIPVLDGGLILFSLIALVFRRRLPDVVVKYSTLAFMVLLIGLMGLLIVRDSWRSYKIHTYKPDTAENVHTNADTSAESR